MQSTVINRMNADNLMEFWRFSKFPVQFGWS